MFKTKPTVEDAARVFEQAHASMGTGWWPSGRNAQAEASVFAWRLVLAWDAMLHGNTARIAYSCWGKKPERKNALLGDFGYKVVDERVGIPSANRLFYPKEYMVDFGVFRYAEDAAAPAALLTMESEMYSGHGVDADVSPAHGYAWDFAKLLWCPSDVRLFVARVGTATISSADRIATLWVTMTDLCRLYAKLFSGAAVISYVLPRTLSADAPVEAGVWNGRTFDRKAINVGLDP